MSEKSETTAGATALAREHWNADRELVRDSNPAWEMPAWSRAPMWRRRPYLLAAQGGKRPE
jgi:hypothetical protein